MKLQHLRYFVAVYEEGSFSAGAQRVNATQSGLSMHVKQLEERYQVTLLHRSSTGVTPTEAGRRFYKQAVITLRAASESESMLRSLGQSISGHVRVGLMPTFTRAVLGPALIACAEAYPNIRVSVVEAFSGELARQVASAQLDFAVVPAFNAELNLSVTHMGSDLEYFMISADSPVQLGPGALLSDFRPLNLVLPSHENSRRRKIDDYIRANRIEVDNTIELDAMFATLDLVARSNWAAILPGILCIPDLDGKRRQVSPLASPPLNVEYMRIEPPSSPVGPAAMAFYDVLKDELEKALTRVGPQVTAGRTAHTPRKAASAAIDADA